MDRSQSPLWAPLFCKVCSRRAAIVVANVLMCGDCFFKHTVAELSRGEAEEPVVHLRVVGAEHANG